MQTVDCLFVCVLTIFRSRVVYFSCTLLTKKVWVVFYAADGMMDPASVSMGRELVGPTRLLLCVCCGWLHAVYTVISKHCVRLAICYLCGTEADFRLYRAVYIRECQRICQPLFSRKLAVYFPQSSSDFTEPRESGSDKTNVLSPSPNQAYTMLVIRYRPPVRYS